MNTNTTSAAADGRRIDWDTAFASDDPAQWWAAACSVARVVTYTDRWVDSTAIHEAACGAFDAIAAQPGHGAVGAAIGGARRALYWERQARFRLVPPASMGSHRWRAQASAAQSQVSELVPFEFVGYSISRCAQTTHGRLPSRMADWLGGHLDDRGWRWPLPAHQAVIDAIEAVIETSRDRAASVITDLHPDLPESVADGLVLLVAGSRRRYARVWPGAVWLYAHHGPAAAAADPGTRTVIEAVVSGRRARPAAATGATIQHRQPLANTMLARYRPGSSRSQRPPREGRSMTAMAS